MYEKSETINELAAALAKAQAEYPVIPKNKTANVVTNGGQKYSYNYADLADVLSAILPILSKHGLAVVQIPTSGSLTTILTHSSGQFISSSFPLRMFDKIQQTGAEITFVRRYSLCSIVGVHGDEDKDATLADGVNSAETFERKRVEIKEPVKPIRAKAEPKTQTSWGI